MGALRAFAAIVTHHNFLICLAAWTTSQALKLLWYWRRTGRWYWHMLVGTGGMPSAHMTLVSSFATLMGLQHGWGSPVFQCALVLALIVMSDAWGARRAAGRHAGILNRIVADFYSRTRHRPRPLRELLGHTPLEVAAGALLGTVFAVLFNPGIR